MDNLTAFSIIALAALIHASFQLGVSMVTLLSSHSAGKKMTAQRTLRLVGWFLAGTMVMTALIVSFLAYLSSGLFRHGTPLILWALVAGYAVGVGLAVWIFYYRRGNGTSLWLPRSFVHFLSSRIKATTLGAEAFSLGLTGVISEMIFVIAPASAAALALISLPRSMQLGGVIFYVLIASIGIILVSILIGSGHSLSRVQRWREANKRFLQFAAGSGLIILGAYLYVDQVLTPTVTLAGVH